MYSNKELIDSLLSSGYADKRVAKAMRRMDRRNFIPKEQKGSAYIDHPLPIGGGQTISAPGVVAFMSTKLDVRDGMGVLEVGAGSGWQAAILGELAGKKGEVWSIERIPELVKNASENLERSGAKNVTVVHGDGTEGYPKKSPFDRIIVTAAAPQIPPPLQEQLAEGGKLLMPVGGSFFQNLIIVEKKAGETSSDSIMSVIFVPLIGKYGYGERP
ncbi:MAG: protein-L-isoaspartate(D-aspartate) O-methyltransferase [Candidatus Micrarchaeota archaeon]